jgi:hypothetical protein
MYKSLGFTEEQTTKAEALDNKTKIGAGPLVRKLQVERRKLGDLKAKKTSIFAVWKQKQAVLSAKKDVDKYFKDTRKSFDALLTSEQKAKYKVMSEEKKKAMDKFKKEHGNGHGDHGPHHEHMGPHHEHMGPPPEDGKFGPKGPLGPEPMGPPPLEETKK